MVARVHFVVRRADSGRRLMDRYWGDWCWSDEWEKQRAQELERLEEAKRFAPTLAHYWHWCQKIDELKKSNGSELAPSPEPVR